MKQLADDFFQLKYFPPNAINVWLVGETIVDAATRRDGKRILRQVEGRTVRQHALTHAHADHQGSSKYICEKLGVPFLVGEGDVEGAEGGPEVMLSKQPASRWNNVSVKSFAGPGHKVDRVLREGDELDAGFVVLETPGHSAGHLAFWRESDRALILGDVLFNQHPLFGIPGLRQPPDFFTPDVPRNRESARRLAGLEPALVVFGHGPPLRDTRKFVEFVASLPS